MSDAYDIIIIGTGAGGGTILRKLAPSGLRILVLERGGVLPQEPENRDEAAVAAGRYQTDERWLDKDGAEFRPYTHYWVGGNTKVYGAALLRLRERDFGRSQHLGGVSAAWPIGYNDLEPYYTQAEQLYTVHGLAGADPTEPPRSAPYPYPPLDMEPRMRELADGFRAIGLRPFGCALGVTPDPHEGACALCRVPSRFDGYPDPSGAKADSELVGVRPSLSADSVTLLTGAKARRIETDPTGRLARAVVVTRNGREERYEGRTIIVACGAINSAALLLRSACDAHPRGLANSSGLVGRNYMRHNNGVLIAALAGGNPSTFQKAFAITDYYHDAPDSPLPLGTIQLMGKPDAATLRDAVGAALAGVAPQDLWRHTVDFFLTAEDLALPENRVTVDPDGRVRLTHRETNVEAYDRLRLKLLDALDRVGRRNPSLRPTATGGFKLGIGGVSHQCGTLRFGADPRASVLDTSCRAHDLDNLYVVDSSFFPSSGAVNPSLTIMANALRVGEIILQGVGASLARREPPRRPPPHP